MMGVQPWGGGRGEEGSSRREGEEWQGWRDGLGEEAVCEWRRGDVFGRDARTSVSAIHCAPRMRHSAEAAQLLVHFRILEVAVPAQQVPASLTRPVVWRHAGSR